MSLPFYTSPNFQSLMYILSDIILKHMHTDMICIIVLCQVFIWLLIWVTHFHSLEGFRILSLSWDLIKSSISPLTFILPQFCLKMLVFLHQRLFSSIIYLNNFLPLHYLCLLHMEFCWKNLASWISLKSLLFSAYHLFFSVIHSLRNFITFSFIWDN